MKFFIDKHSKAYDKHAKDIVHMAIKNVTEIRKV